MTLIRQNQSSIWIGQKGSGKTTLLKEKIMPVDRKKFLIVDKLNHTAYRDIYAGKATDLKRWTTGKMRIIVPKGGFPFLFEQIEAHVSNTTIVWEDCARYMGRKSPPDEVLEFIYESKQRNIDMIFMFHAFTFAYTDFFRLCDNLVLFKVQDTPRLREDFVANSSGLWSMYKEIQASSNPYFNKKISLQ